MESRDDEWKNREKGDIIGETLIEARTAAKTYRSDDPVSTTRLNFWPPTVTVVVECLFGPRRVSSLLPYRMASTVTVWEWDSSRQIVATRQGDEYNQWGHRLARLLTRRHLERRD